MNSFRYTYSSFNDFMNTIYIYNNNNYQMNYQMTNFHLVGLSYLVITLDTLFQKFSLCVIFFRARFDFNLIKRIYQMSAAYSVTNTNTRKI
jgi:hypothetical protein